MKIEKQGLLGFVVCSGHSWPVFLGDEDPEDGVVTSEEMWPGSVFIPVPQPAFIVGVCLGEEGHEKYERLGFEIPGGGVFDWNALAQDKEHEFWNENRLRDEASEGPESTN